MSRRHLTELTVKDLALVSDLRLSFAPGLTVLTGETGAGKSMLVDALIAVTGGRVAAGMVRAGSDRARIDAVFAAEDEDDLVLSREIAAGRSPARIDDRAVPVARLAETGGGLVAVHTQGEQTRLARPAVQRSLLDLFGGHDALITPVRVAHARLRALAAERLTLGGDPRERARRIELLGHEVEEITGAGLAADEEERLTAALRLARAADDLRAAARSAREHLAGERSATDHLAEAEREIGSRIAADPGLTTIHERLTAALEETRDLAGELRRYADAIDADPAQLLSLEARDTQLHDLRRRYGATVPEILTYAERASAELTLLASHEQRLARLDSEERDARAEYDRAAAALGTARRATGERLSEAVVAQLAELGLARCRFRIELAPQDPDATGTDRVRFLIQPNPGESEAPLGEIASGGELSRIMLAIEAVLAAHDDTPVLVFDEVDSGVGGRLGEVLGRRLWTLARHHQVLCVTHLPQVAVYADRHLHVRKEVLRGRTHVHAEKLEGAALLEELGAMLGVGGRPAELVAAAREWTRRPTLAGSRPDKVRLTGRPHRRAREGSDQ